MIRRRATSSFGTRPGGNGNRLETDYIWLQWSAALLRQARTRAASISCETSIALRGEVESACRAEAEDVSAR